MTKIKVDFKDAADLANAGFTIECYVLAQPEVESAVIIKPQKTRKPRTDVMHDGSFLALNTKGREPVKGYLGLAWKEVKRELWGEYPKKIYTRKEVRECLRKHGAEDPSNVAYLTYNLKCLERYSDK